MPANTDKIIKIITDHLGVDQSEIIPQANLRSDLGADDMAVIEIAMELQKEFELSIPDEESNKFQTVGDIITFINRMFA